MARMTVGGRILELTHEDVVAKLRNQRPEPIREHLVEMPNDVYPPKQVLATMTGWNRTSFTTMEAQRVLTKLGFVCRRSSTASQRGTPKDQAPSEPTVSSLDNRVTRLEAALVVAQQAVAHLAARLDASQRKANA
jgi:hypothetical protein